MRGVSWVAFLYWGTVLDDGEDPGASGSAPRPGPAGALAYHATYELVGASAVRDIPAATSGSAW